MGVLWPGRPLAPAVVLLLVIGVHGIPKSEFFPYGAEVYDDVLPKKDEISSPELKFTTPLLFYKQEYNGAYINSNGLLSFMTELPNFYNVPFPLDYPLIAPLYSDVDTRGAGDVFYRVTYEEDELRRFDERIARYFSGGASFQSQELLVATWDGVGYYNSRADKTNTFQLVLGWNGRETFVQFLYADDGIQWIAGEGKTAHHKDARGQAGLISGDGRYTELRHSGTDQVRHLDRLSNCQEAGVYIYRIGRIEGNKLDEPDINVGSGPASLEQSATCATGSITCHSEATCHDHEDGFCCVCNAGFYGNGKSCLTRDEPLRIMGDVFGTLNGFTIDGQQLQAYAVVSDGRSYTSVAKVVAELGYDFQTLMPVSDIVGWMFAKPATGVRNGFQMTGGVANATIDVDFPQTGHHVVLQQDFGGLNVFNHLSVETRLNGAVPAIAFGEKVEMDGYTNTVVRIGRGRLRITSQRQFRQAGNAISIPMNLEAEVQFDECPWQPEQEELNQLRHIVDRNFIVYEEPEQIVRFASSNNIEAISDESPCKDAERKCGPNSVCTPEGHSGYRCDCRPGFTYEYREGPSDVPPEELRICVDIDECRQGEDNCHEHAMCTNEFGSYSCLCMPDYTGNGQNCEKLLSCADLTCGENAACYEYSRGSPVCECDIGFTGDGTHCEEVVTPAPSGAPDASCRSSSDCGLNAECQFSEWQQRALCVCAPGYTAQANRCVATDTTPGPCGDFFCHSHASCVEVELGRPGCVCDPGFYGNGLECRAAEQQGNLCQSANDCGPNAECIFADWAGGNVCVCLQGYFGDGMRCVVATPLAVLCGGVECHPAAECVELEGVPQCVCNAGLQGDGYTVCKTQPVEKRCDTFADCGPNAECDFADWLGANICFCRAGFFGDGVNCSVATTVAVLCRDVTCHEHAECLEYEVNNPQCVCNVGYIGDGVNCEAAPEDIPCETDAQCGAHSTCVYAPWVDRYVCLCDQEYVREGGQCVFVGPIVDPLPGMGGCLQDSDCAVGEICDYEVATGLFVCMPTPTTEPSPSAAPSPDRDCSVDNICSENGVCGFDLTADRFVCACMEGFEGDGFNCQPATTPAPEEQPSETPEGQPEGPEEPEAIPERLDSTCVFGFCVCPDGYQLTDDQEECFLLKDDEDQTPLPYCYDGACYCPVTYRYDKVMEKCVPTGEGEYDTKGPSGTDGEEGEAGEEVAPTAVTEAPAEVPEVPECRGDEDCDVHALCSYNATNGRYQCSCFPGYTEDGSVCTPDPNADCSVLKDCHKDATCVYDQDADRYHCQCRRGYEGDGRQCDEVAISCNIVNNCGERAECMYVPEELRFSCRCRPGFSGDGYTCRPSISCYDEPTQCDVNAACVPDLDGFRCVCLKGFVGDGRRCSPAPRHEGGFLLLNQGSAIVKVPFEARKRGRPIILEPTQTAVGIDTDCLDGRIFWSDVAGRKIKAAAYNGSQRVDFAMGGISSPEGVAVDFVSRNVYWTDSSRDAIEVASIETGNRFTVISSGLVNVRGVAVHPGRGTIYWADWNRREPRIERAALDGSNRQVLLDAELGLPNSLAIDFATDELCWTDAGTKSVECFSLTHRTRRLVADGASYPFGIAITDDNIYWTDWNDKKIHVVNKATGERGKSLRSVLGTSGKLYGLVATPRTCPQVTNVCGRQNGGCPAEQLCLPTDGGSRVCTCPDQYVTEPSGPSICRQNGDGR
ncbi:nidogen-like isoform X1 [Amphibalanus amphitrite]|uniref:nidogen-like isoform X1 n=1 Tax=Amphibalanus amphitrite TaxID=1232801 RepID=UPI001C927C45|nr:nidogen-like isoform X1 [Amphibalanus amphitrite]